NARVEAQVLEALSGGDFMQKFVTAALNEKVSVDRYSSEKKTLIRHTLEEAIKSQAKAVVAEEVAVLEPAIREEVRRALKKSVGVIADSLVSGFVANSSGNYPSIEV